MWQSLMENGPAGPASISSISIYQWTSWPLQMFCGGSLSTATRLWQQLLECPASTQCIQTTTHSPNEVSNTLGPERATYMIEEQHICVFSPQGVLMIAKHNTPQWGNFTTPQQLHGSMPRGWIQHRSKYSRTSCKMICLPFCSIFSVLR